MLVGIAWVGLACGGGGGAPAAPDGGAEVDQGAVDLGVALAVPDGPEPLDSLLEPLRDEHGAVGLAAAVLDPEGLVAVGAVGLRRQGGTEGVTTDDRWHLGSDTKAMTATLAALLVEAGELTWEQTVAETFVDFADAIHPDLQDITLVELLTHWSGLTGNMGAAFAGLWARLWEAREDVMAERLFAVETMLSAEPELPPRTAFRYSNAGYIVAGAMLEVVTGQPWETLMRERLFGPLGMGECGFGAPGTAGAADQPWGHSGTSTLEPVPPGPSADNPPALGPAGTVHCSLDSWARFVALHLRGAEGDTELLPQSTFTRLHTPVDGYAYGWGVGSPAWASGPALAHAGSNTLFYAVAWVGLGDGRAYLVVTNRGGPPADRVTAATLTALVESYPPSD
ncbi:MAG: penicillin-binding protein [Sandaracinus sp.]|nr:penicillin-binding protein [Sandaracinus sp.]